MENYILKLLQKQEERLINIESQLENQSKTVLNLDDVCKLTGLSKSHIYKLTCYSKVPHFKQSKHLYFDRQEIENWLKENRVKTADEIGREASSYVTTNKRGGSR